MRIWDLGENKCSHQLIPEDDVSVASVTVASDGSMLCAGNNSVRLLFLSRHFVILTVRRARSTSGAWCNGAK